MSCPTSGVLRVIGCSRKQLLARPRPRGSRGGHTGRLEHEVSNGKRIWLAGRIDISLLKIICTDILLFPIASGKVAVGVGVGVVFIGNWVEGNMGGNAPQDGLGNTGTGTTANMGNTGTFTGVKQDTGEKVIQEEESPTSQDMGSHTKQEIGRSVGPDLKEVQNSSKHKSVDKSEGVKTDQDNQVLPIDKTFNSVNHSSDGSAKESSKDEKSAFHQQSEEYVEKVSQVADLPTEAQSPISVIASHRQYSSADRTFSQQVAHMIWVGLRLSQILLSILLPTALIFLRWM